MKRTNLIQVVASAVAFALPFSVLGAGEELAPETLIRRYALIIAKEDGGAGRSRLKYAGTDASALSNVLSELGGVDPKDEILLSNPDRGEIIEGMAKIKSRVTGDRSSNTRKELFIYYSGHSDEDGLLLGRERLSYRDLKRAIQESGADVNVVILDSCSSGSLTRLKGGQKRPSFLADSLSKLKGYVVLTSSSADEAAQESDRIKGSYFTHYLVSGLRGGADLNTDGRVTLNEAYQYAYHQTLSGTEKTLAGAQHPSYSIQLAGSGELVMSDLRKTSGRLLLDKTLGGKFFVRDSKDRIVAEVEKKPGKPLLLGLEPGRYSVVHIRDRGLAVTQVELRKNLEEEIRTAQFHPVQPESTTLRGGGEESLAPAPEYVSVPAEFSVYPGVSTNVADAERTQNAFALSLLYAKQARLRGASISLLGGSFARDGVEGAQLSLAFNRTQGELAGAQISAGFNEAPRGVTGAQLSAGANLTDHAEVTGAQITGGYNVAGAVVGAQISAGYNEASRIAGAQIGGYNVSGGGVGGAQLGVANFSPADVSGAQLGAVNFAKSRVWGAQIGAVNHSSDEVSGVQLGALNDAPKPLAGAQIGALNVGDQVSGLQIGAVNVARAASGVQVGLVNITSEKGGVPIGLVNVAPESVFRFGYSYTDLGFHEVSVKYGPLHSYTFLRYGRRVRSGRMEHETAAGLGTRFDFGMASLAFEAAYQRLDAIYFLDRSTGANLVQVLLLPGIRVTDWLGLAFGPNLNVKLGDTQDFPDGNPRKSPWVGYSASVEFSI